MKSLLLMVGLSLVMISTAIAMEPVCDPKDQENSLTEDFGKSEKIIRIEQMSPKFLYVFPEAMGAK